ncbi:MAG: acyl-CoA dehydratase activase-related protein [Desulfocapsaceae bacterium]
MYLQDHTTDLSSRPLHGCHLGMDLGSTTAKLVLIDPSGTIIFQRYLRHQAEVLTTLLSMLVDLQKAAGIIELYPIFTGSAGMGLAEQTGIGFIQEVVAQSEAVRKCRPDCRMLIDIGGEDCKMIFFDHCLRPDMRMNGNCAGGTGAFIDQMSSLLDVPLDMLDETAHKSKYEHVIASRCGVFAKTDVQNLINTGAEKSDIARSVFKAVACQVVTSLARGRRIEGPVMFTGGPLYFFETLRDALLDVLNLTEEAVVIPSESLLYAAYGAALSIDHQTDDSFTLEELIDNLNNKIGKSHRSEYHPPLFSNRTEFLSWFDHKSSSKVASVPLSQAATSSVYLGIDAGSTTTKLVAIDGQGQIVFKYYSGNRGDPLAKVRIGLQKLEEAFQPMAQKFTINGAAVTGYGEDLVKSAFAFDVGIVETLAHYRAAREFEPDVSFILDIGGQDMKAVFVANDKVEDIEVNESCSSGCGSFIETFGDALGHSPEEFGELACFAKHPVDLGSRCTVFMNSCVKQALRQGNDVSDVAAGLSYSVIQNCLNKVLRISDVSALGPKVVVQGGTFKNPAVLRAFEKLLGIEVIRPDIAEYMGAYGAALIARERRKLSSTSMEAVPSELLSKCISNKTTQTKCQGCTNHCLIQSVHFSNARKFHTGNRCERIFSNRNRSSHPGRNLVAEKLSLLESFPDSESAEPILSIGLPMVLNNWENYPFWATLFSGVGFRLIRSRVSESKILKESAFTVMSDNICYPAKLAHAHIFDLIKRGVDRIFYPRVTYEQSQFADSANQYNCPIVTGYPDVIDCAIDPSGQGVQMDSPLINFLEVGQLRKGCIDYLRSFGIEKSIFDLAFGQALEVQQDFRKTIRDKGEEVIASARAAGQQLIVLGGRPYHVDPMINHNIAEMIAAMGLHVLTEDSLPLDTIQTSENLQVVDQWEYSNRLYRAAQWTGVEPLAEFIQLNSFGCGPDAVIIDEIKAILSTYSKTPVVLKIDEITSIGSARLRVRSLVESKTAPATETKKTVRKVLPLYKDEDRNRTILFPDFSPVYSLFAQSSLVPLGYQVEILPPPDKESIRFGLKYTNNDICYPAIITVGDIIKAMKSGLYDRDKVAASFTETGGQCRATNYHSLIKKGLINAGFGDIPVITASFKKFRSNDQPGFRVNRLQLISLVLSSLLVADQLVRMYHATAVRERKSGEALAVLKRHIDIARQNVGSWTLRQRQKLLGDAIEEFNSIATYVHDYPRAGLVGEIYVKYNPFSNSNIVERLMRRGIEVVVPPLLTFFTQTFVNISFNHSNNIEKSKYVERKTQNLLHRIVISRVREVNGLMSQFRHSLDPISVPDALGNQASRVVSLVNQAGEGWLLPGEVISMAESGIRNIISLQPFGCIANHVVSKGIGSKLSRLFPDLNFLNLDMDAGNSDVNLQNRLDFFIHSAKAQDHSRMLH